VSKDHDLDLTFITTKVIAMSFPGSKLEGIYRNNISDVANYFDLTFGNKYYVYNCCDNKSYDNKHFHGRVKIFEVEDHNVPTLQQMWDFAKHSSVNFHIDECITFIHRNINVLQNLIFIYYYLTRPGYPNLKSIELLFTVKVAREGQEL